MLSLAGLLLCVGGFALVAVALAGGDTARTMTSRIALISPSAPRRAATSMAPMAALTWQERGERALEAIFAFRMQRRWGTSTGPLQLLLIGLVAAVLAWLIARVAFGFGPILLWIATLGAFVLVPRLVLRREQRIADAQFSELLPDAIDMVVRIVRAGLPVGMAIRTVGQESAAPLSTIFLRVAGQAEIGLPLDEALAQIGATVGNADFRFFAVAVALQQTTGGNLAETLETLSQIIRRRRAVRLKSQAATAEVRISAVVLGSIPFVVAGALYILAPAYFDQFFADPRGRVILLLAILCLLMAGLTMRAMIRNALSAAT